MIFVVWKFGIWQHQPWKHVEVESFSTLLLKKIWVLIF